jgi:hypothetical protein
LSASVSELISDRRECKNDMEVFSTELNEIVILLISVVKTSSSSFDFVTNLNLFIRREKIGNFTTVKKIVDVFQE